MGNVIEDEHAKRTTDSFPTEHNPNQDLDAVSAWFNKIGFSKYSDTFIANGFDSMDIIKALKEPKDLEDIGIDSSDCIIIMHFVKMMNEQNQDDDIVHQQPDNIRQFS